MTRAPTWLMRRPAHSRTVSAGAMMKEDFKEGEAPQPAGSFMIYKANSIDQAR